MSLDSTLGPADAWRTIRNNARNHKLELEKMIATMNAGEVTLEYVFDVYRYIYSSRVQFELNKTAPNLTAYVQSLKNDGTYDAVAEITSVTTAQQDCMDWVDVNAAGLSLSGDTAQNWLASGSVATNRFSKPATAGLRTLMQVVVDLIAS